MEAKMMLAAVAAGMAAAAACGAKAEKWPSIKHFEGATLRRVALPLGGTGCGSISLDGRGELVDWEIMNRPNKTCNGAAGIGGAIGRTFFAIHAKSPSRSWTKMLAGPVPDDQYYGSGHGSIYPQAGLPRFSVASFDAAFPFGTVHLSDPSMPVKVDIKGFSPFTPGDSASSCLPVASLEYEVENLSGEPLEVSVCAYVRNISGNDGREPFNPSHKEKPNKIYYREAGGLRGLFCPSGGVPEKHPAFGSFALATPDAGSVTYTEALVPNSWNRTILDFWDDLSDDGGLMKRPAAGNDAFRGGICLKKPVPAGATVSFRWAFAWNFPNMTAWGDDGAIVGNWYSQFYKDGWDAAVKIVPRLPGLEARSLAFTRKILALDAPAEIKEAALSNLAVLKSQTVFRIPSGHLLGWEGVSEHSGSCKGTCTHVWNYENAVACLFPDLSRTMRDVEFNRALDKSNGAMDFRVDLPFGPKRNHRVAADGQMGCVMKAYRDWKISGDGKWLAAIWPNVRKALEFAWIPAEKWTWNAKWRKGGWDVGKSGLMDGEQHNTMDVNYYGPNPQMGFWYLGALRAAEEMAKAVGDAAFAAECRAIYEKGSKRIDEELFNGDYYVQRITPGHGELPYQLGECCLVDQLVGQQMAHLWGLGDLAKRENLRKTCESIAKWNYVESFSGHFNNMRVYGAGNEAGTLMGSWPRGRLKVPFPYFGEVMTGFEYVAAAEMIFQGLDAEGLRTVKAVRDRHDGARRNPFDEPECGHNYARSMASWNCLLAWLATHGGDPASVIFNK